MIQAIRHLLHGSLYALLGELYSLSVTFCVRFVQPKQANNLGTAGKVKEGSNPDRT